MAEQLGLEGMPTRLFSAFPTRLTTWLDCPRRYRMTYLDRPTPPKGAPWAHTSVGAAVHTALKRWYDLPPAVRTPAAAGDLVEECWLTDGFRDDAQCDAWRTRSRAMVEQYVSGLDPHDEPRGVERTVALRTDTLAVSGRVDRIDERHVVDADGVIDEGADEDPPDTELVVVDYKTGRWVPDTDEARGSLALALYALGAQRTLRQPCRTVELHHLPSATVVRWVHTEESLTRHLRRAEAIGAEAAAAEVEWKGGLSDRAGRLGGDVPSPPRVDVRLVRLRPALPRGASCRPDQGTLGRASRLKVPSLRRQRSRRGPGVEAGQPAVRTDLGVRLPSGSEQRLCLDGTALSVEPAREVLLRLGAHSLCPEGLQGGDAHPELGLDRLGVVAAQRSDQAAQPVPLGPHSR